MAEYFDLGINLISAIDEFYLRRQAKAKTTSDNDNINVENVKFRYRPKWIDPCMFEVRNSVCVAGVNRDAVLQAKAWIASLMPDSVAIESFHARNSGDVKDGALLVPKVVLVAKHNPGRKLIDNTSGNSGQLDFLYDEVCRVRADVLVIYMDLPRCIYPPNKCFIYHEKVGELLFRDQPILKELALENELITVVEPDPPSAAAAKSPPSLNNVQRNVIREWLQRPVGSDHGVYRAASNYLSDSLQRQQSAECYYYSESEAAAYQLRRFTGIPRGLAVGWGNLSSGFASATESRRRPDEFGTTVNAKRKRKSYGSMTMPSVTGSGSSSRRRRRGDSQELLKPLMESANFDDDAHELIALDDGVANDNLGFVRECLANARSVVTTNQL